MSEYITPGVMLDGVRYEPPGWMWILGFALGGCDWAIRKADTPEFREGVREWLREHGREDLRQEIVKAESRIAELKEELRIT